MTSANAWLRSEGAGVDFDRWIGSTSSVRVFLPLDGLLGSPSWRCAASRIRSEATGKGAPALYDCFCMEGTSPRPRCDGGPRCDDGRAARWPATASHV